VSEYKTLGTDRATRREKGLGGQGQGREGGRVSEHKGVEVWVWGAKACGEYDPITETQNEREKNTFLSAEELIRQIYPNQSNIPQHGNMNIQNKTKPHAISRHTIAPGTLNRQTVD